MIDRNWTKIRNIAYIEIRESVATELNVIDFGEVSWSGVVDTSTGL